MRRVFESFLVLLVSVMGIAPAEAMVGALVVTASGPEYAFGEASATVAAGKRTEGVTIKTEAP